jgi:hypothetical protein
MFRTLQFSYPINNAEAITPVVQLQFETCVNVFCAEYSKSCPAVRRYDPDMIKSDFNFSRDEYISAVKKFYSPRTHAILTLVVAEEDGDIALHCVSYLTLWPTMPGAQTRVLYRFKMGI